MSHSTETDVLKEIIYQINKSDHREEDLQRMLSYIGVRYDVIVRTSSSFEEAVYQIIEYFNRTGSLDVLLEGVRQFRPSAYREIESKLSFNQKLHLLHPRRLVELKFSLNALNDYWSSLTITVLERLLLPYLKAVEEIQNTLDSIFNNPNNLVRVRQISQNSPVSVSLEGAAQATEVVREMVVPWRREHSKTLAELDEQEKLAQIESVKAEVQETRARAHKQRAEAKKIDFDSNAEKQKVEIERMKLENAKLKLEIEEKRINLALSILDRLAPNLSESQRIKYAMELLKPIEVLTESPLLLIERNDEE